MVVLDIVRMAFRTMDDSNLLFHEIDSLHFPVKELGFSQQFADRIYDMGDVQVARGDLMQHGGKEEKVFAVYHGNFDVRLARQQPL